MDIDKSGSDDSARRIDGGFRLAVHGTQRDDLSTLYAHIPAIARLAGSVDDGAAGYFEIVRHDCSLTG